MVGFAAGFCAGFIVCVVIVVFVTAWALEVDEGEDESLRW